jgi:hypothetical protein
MLIQVPFGPLSMPVLFSLSGGGSGTSGTLPFG